MKTITSDYKNQIKELGREIDIQFAYVGSGGWQVLHNEDIISLNIHYEGDLLKSVMKQIDVVLKQDLPLNTAVTVLFGIKVNGSFEYIRFDGFNVYSSEKLEDSNTYKLTCYDRMLRAMKDYVTPKLNNVEITYPITINNYINAICSHLNLTFKNYINIYPNYNKVIPNELYLDENGESLSYTFRDVLDELAQVTASTICVNNNQLELRYINDTINEEYLKDVNVNFGEIIGPINTITFKRTEDLDVYSLSNPIDLADNLKNEIVISDNQILNNENRSQYAQDILNQLYGLTYSINDFNSTGITYYELCDKYYVSIGNETYTCVMFNDEINIVDGGLQEYIYTDRPEENPTDYNTTTSNEREDERTGIIINKKIGEVDIRGKTINLTADNIQIDSTNFSVDENGNITATGGTIAGYTITDNELYAEYYARYDYTQSDLDRIRGIISGQITPTDEDYEKYDLSGDGQITNLDWLKVRKLIDYGITTTNPLRIVMSTGNDLLDSAFKLEDGQGNEFIKVSLGGFDVDTAQYSSSGKYIQLGDTTGNNIYIANGYVTSSATKLFVNIILGDHIIDHNSINVTSAEVRIRGIDGYITGSSYKDYATDNNYKCEAKAITNNCIILTIERKNNVEFSNATNNTPISMEGYFEFELN